MIGRKQILIWLGAVIILIVLYLASSTDLILKEKEPEIYRVSVILDDATDEAYANFSKGIEDAAQDHQIDVNIISLYTAGDGQEQQELINREIEDDAHALILIPVEAETIIQEDLAINLPIMYVQGDAIPGSHINRGTYCFDWKQMGIDLAKRAKEHCAGVPRLVLINGSHIYGRREQIMEGAVSVLGTEQVLAIIPEDGEDLRNQLRAAIGEQEDLVLVGMDERSVERILHFLAGPDREQTGSLRAVYSVTGSVLALNSLRRGTIDGVYYTDDYAAGYQCVELIRNRLDNMLASLGNLNGEYYFLDQNDLNSGEYDRLLYPME